MNNIQMTIRFLIAGFGAVLFIYAVFSDTRRKGSLAVGFTLVGAVTIMFYDNLSILLGGGTAINAILLMLVVVGWGSGTYYLVAYQRERASAVNSSP